MKKERILYYDVLNVLACISVIAMHCNGIVHTYSNSPEWKQALIVEVIAYWAVPVFFMLSGAKMLTYREKYDTQTFLKKRIGKIVLPWAAWCLLWFAYKVYILNSIQITSLRNLIETIYNGIFYNNFQSVYWFFIPMIMTYFCMPVLSNFITNRKILWYIVGITFITYSLLPELCAIVGFPYNSSFYFPLGGGYILYVILGYLLSTCNESARIRHTIYGLGVGSAVLRYAGTYCLSIKNNAKDTTYWGYLYFTCAFLSVAVFLFFKNRDYTNLSDFSKKVLRYLSGCSFGVYLMHSMIMELLCRGFDIDKSLLWWRTMGIFIVYTLCLLGVSVLKKIPVISRILVP